MNGFKKQQQRPFPPVPSILTPTGFNPDVRISILHETSTGRAMVEVNKPMPYAVIAHLLIEAGLNNVKTLIAQGQMIVDPNGRGLVEELPESTEPEATPEVVE